MIKQELEMFSILKEVLEKDGDMITLLKKKVDQLEYRIMYIEKKVNFSWSEYLDDLEKKNAEEKL